jgi:hypothetical protein
MEQKPTSMYGIRVYTRMELSCVHTLTVSVEYSYVYRLDLLLVARSELAVRFVVSLLKWKVKVSLAQWMYDKHLPSTCVGCKRKHRLVH